MPPMQVGGKGLTHVIDTRSVLWNLRHPGRSSVRFRKGTGKVVVRIELETGVSKFKPRAEVCGARVCPPTYIVAYQVLDAPAVTAG